MRPQVLRPAGARLALMILAALLTNCRASNPVDEAEQAELESRPWFDMYGEPAACDVPAGGCPVGSFDSKFVDLCVSKGFQAKSCGCVATCSGKVIMKEKPAQTQASAGPDKADCTAEDLEFIAGVGAGQPTEYQRCVQRLVCEGDSRDCQDDAKKDALHLRDLSKSNCRMQVVAKVCSKGMADSLACESGNIDFLSALYARAFAPSERALRRCLRESLCNGNNRACGEGHGQTSRTAKAALDDGCEFWLASFCSLDPK